jgi:hypothetical protein
VGSALLTNRDFGRTIIDVTIPNSPQTGAKRSSLPADINVTWHQCISNGANCYLLFERMVALLAECSGGCEAEIGIRSRYCGLLIHSDDMIVNPPRLCDVLEENRHKVVRLLEYGWIGIGDPVTLGNLSNQ